VERSTEGMYTNAVRRGACMLIILSSAMTSSAADGKSVGSTITIGAGAVLFEIYAALLAKGRIAVLNVAPTPSFTHPLPWLASGVFLKFKYSFNYICLHISPITRPNCIPCHTSISKHNVPKFSFAKSFSLSPPIQPQYSDYRDGATIG
jgi:hypothetical protein